MPYWQLNFGLPKRVLVGVILKITRAPSDPSVMDENSPLGRWKCRDNNYAKR